MDTALESAAPQVPIRRRQPQGEEEAGLKDPALRSNLYTNPKTLRACFALGFSGMGHRATQKDKAARALLAGFDLLDTADWFAGAGARGARVV